MMTAALDRPRDTGEAQMRRAATFQPATFSDRDNGVDVIWSTGAAVTRFDWWDGALYEETLSLEPGAVRLDRLNTGGPVLDSHQDRDLGKVVGSVIPGSVRLEDGKALARIRLADTPDVADVVAKVKAGHIRGVSVGYHVHTYQRTERPGERAQMHALDWEPTELSLVTIPADAGAHVRSRSASEMTRIIDRNNEARDDDDQIADEARDEQRGAVYGRGGPSPRRNASIEMIRRACARTDELSRQFERELIERHERSRMSEAELYEAINAELVVLRYQPGADVRSGAGRQRIDGSAQLRAGFVDALYARISGNAPGEAGREYAGASIVDMARALLEAQGERVRWDRPSTVIDKITGHARSGQHTTSDFASIISEVGRSYLVDMFTTAPSPLKVLGRKRDFPDFKMRFAVTASVKAGLRLVPENAEYKRITFEQSHEGTKLNTYGEIFSISRQALINDDLGIFADMVKFWARAQAETEASFFAGLIAGTGVVMEDTKTLYHADHGNLLAAAAITTASLSTARQTMRTIKNQDGVTPANVVPKYLVVGPAKETEAEQALATIAAAHTADSNPFAGQLELVVDPRLAGNSWRLFADPVLNPVIEYGNLEGEGGLFTDARVGFDVDGVDFKARMDIGAGAIDWRGTAMNPGA